MRKLPRPVNLDIQEGNTVEGVGSREVIGVLSDKPIRYIDLAVGDSVTAEHFKRQPSGSLSFEDFGGSREIVDRARELIELPLKHRDTLAKIGTRQVKHSAGQGSIIHWSAWDRQDHACPYHRQPGRCSVL